MGDGEASEATQVFVRHLRMMVELVGKPSSRRLEGTIEARVGKHKNFAKRATIDDHLAGRRKKVPPWPLVRELWQACQDIAEKDQLPVPVSVLGEEIDWHQVWDAATRGIVAHSPPLHLDGLGYARIQVPPEVVPVKAAPVPATLAGTAPANSSSVADARPSGTAEVTPGDTTPLMAPAAEPADPGPAAAPAAYPDLASDPSGVSAAAVVEAGSVDAPAAPLPRTRPGLVKADPVPVPVIDPDGPAGRRDAPVVRDAGRKVRRPEAPAGLVPRDLWPLSRRRDLVPRRPSHAADTQLGYTVCAPELTEGGGWVEILEWHAEVGDAVDVNQPLVTAESEQMLILELPVPVTGQLTDILVPTGRVPAGTPLCRIVGYGQVVPGLLWADPCPCGSGRDYKACHGVQDYKQSQEVPPYITPLVRKLAAELGVDLAKVVGTGVGGRVRKTDVLLVTEANKKAAGQPLAPAAVSMPQLGEYITEGTVDRWLKREGDHVEAGETLLEISTDKVSTEIPSPASGILREITVAEDETAEVGAHLATIEPDQDP